MKRKFPISKKVAELTSKKLTSGVCLSVSLSLMFLSLLLLRSEDANTERTDGSHFQFNLLIFRCLLFSRFIASFRAFTYSNHITCGMSVRSRTRRNSAAPVEAR